MSIVGIMSENSIDAIVDGFKPERKRKRNGESRGGTVTIWALPEYKELYDKIQEETGGTFVDIVRDVLYLTIDKTADKMGLRTEAKAS